jgi:DNA-binding beta-propeller fold protein YncE
MTLSISGYNHDIKSNMSGVYYIATSGDNLYYTNSSTDTVTCCDLHGTTQWDFKAERVLENPRGISVDNDGNVYVIGCNSNNVVVISADGQRHRQLLSSEESFTT